MSTAQQVGTRGTSCARCGACSVRFDSADPNNMAIRVCDDCATILGEETDQ